MSNTLADRLKPFTDKGLRLNRTTLKAVFSFLMKSAGLFSVTTHLMLASSRASRPHYGTMTVLAVRDADRGSSGGGCAVLLSSLPVP